MTDIITEKFELWTKGKNSKDARVAIFDEVREIPYQIVPELRDPKVGPQKILELNKGACQPKHYLLGNYFSMLGIPVKYMTYEFKWSEQSIRYPDHLKKLARELPSSFHLAVKAEIDGKWVLVDATWNKCMAKLGFPVNDDWDGASDTKNAVLPLSELEHETPHQRYGYEMEKRKNLTEKAAKIYSEFIQKFNQWIEAERQIP